MLNITFGILSNENKPNINLNKLMNSILLQNIPISNYEIIVVHSYDIKKNHKNEQH